MHQGFLHLVAFVLATSACVTPVIAETFYAGAATADLTPGDGVSLDGPISKPGPVRGVHDPLLSRALAMKLGDTTLLIVINDMCMIDREVFDAAKSIVHDRTGVAVANQLMAATHSHATPRVTRISNRPPDEAYRDFVAKRIADAATAAVHRLAPAKFGVGTFQMPGLAACRRSICEPGSVSANPFGDKGEIVKSVSGKSGAVIKAAGPVDPEFSLLSIQHVDGRPLAVLGNFSVHYCGGYAKGQVSADYFGYYARRLEAQLASNDAQAPFVGMMSNATSGDIGSFRRVDRPSEPWDRMQYFGELLADRTLEVLKTLDHHAPTRLRATTRELALTVRKPDPQRIRWAKDLLAHPDSETAHPWSRIYAQEAMHLTAFPDQYSVPLQTVCIDDFGIAAAPCEIFSETGLKVKAGSPFAQTMILELANGYSGYLPSSQQHQWGGYETWPARSSHLEINAEEKIREGLLKQLVRLHAE